MFFHWGHSIKGLELVGKDNFKSQVLKQILNGLKLRLGKGFGVLRGQRAVPLKVLLHGHPRTLKKLALKFGS